MPYREEILLKTYSKLLQNTVRTISNWKNENRPIINLLEKYFLKEELEEFINTGKIAKQELIKNYDFKDLEQKLNEKNINQNRLNEIIKLLIIYDTQTLQNALYEALSKNQVMLVETIEYLNPRHLKKITKLDFLIKFEKFLDEYVKEKESTYPLPEYLDKNDPKNQIWYESEQALNYFNDKIGFDFSESDRLLIYNIISRYRVYNTLYDLDKAPKD